MLSPPLPLSGGFQHETWRLETVAGRFAVKRLHPLCAADPACRRRCEHGERLARSAAQAGLPAVAALEGPLGPLLQVGDAAVMVYAWEEGHLLPPSAAPPAQASVIGGMMARLHRLESPWEADDAPAPEWFPPGHWPALVERVSRHALGIAPALEAALPALLAWNDATRQAVEHLRDGWVHSHRDLDQKNVLWRDPVSPRLLDWEAAGPVHPALEVMGAALNWAGQSAGPPDRAVFGAFLDAYRRHAPLDPQALRHAATAVLGKWLVWLDVCLGRALQTGTDGPAALGAAAHALRTLDALSAATPRRLAWCDWAMGSRSALY